FDVTATAEVDPLALHVALPSSTIAGGGNDLTVNSPLTAFNDAVTNVGTLTTDAAGTTTIGADISGATLDFNDSLTLVVNAALTGTTMVDFGSTIAGGGNDLTVNSPLTAFNGAVTDVGTLTTDAAGTTTVGADISGTTLNFNDAMTLVMNAIMTGTTAVNFGSTIGGGGFDLTVNSPLTAFNGAVTNVGTLTTDAAGTTTVGADISGTVLAFNDALTLTGNTTFTGTTSVDFAQTIAANGNDLTVNGNQIRFNDGASNVNTFQANAGLFVRLEGQLTANTAGFTAPIIFLRDAAVTTTGNQTYTGGLFFGTLAGNFVTTLTGPNVFFNGMVDSQGVGAAPSGLRVVGDARFNGDVGSAFGGLLSLEVTGSTVYDLGAAQAITVNSQIYGGPVTVANNLLMRSVNDRQIRFDGTLDRDAGAIGLPMLTIDTAGDTIFNGIVGGTRALGTLNTTGGGTTFINSGSMRATNLDFDDAVSLGSNAVLDGIATLDFASTVQGNGNSLTLLGPVTNINGAVSGIDVLTTDAPGFTRINNTSVEAQQVLFGDAVLVTGAGLVRGFKLVDFGSSVDGAGASLTVRSNERINFRGDVGSLAALTMLDAEACRDGTRNEIVFFGDRMVTTVGGNIILNGAGRAAPGSVASIASTGSLTLNATGGGSVLVGQNEKVTAIGNLSINGTTATFGDLNSGGNIAVNAGAINIWRRQPGGVLTAAGTAVGDLGADLVALGSMSFSTAPSFIGAGATPMAAAGGGIINPGGLIIRPLSAVLSTTLVDPSGRILDLAIATGASDDLATVLDEDTPGMVSDRTPKDPFLDKAMEELSIFVRDIKDHELLSGANGAAIYTDHRQTGLSQQQLQIVSHRLNRSTMLGVLEQYAAIFLRETVDPETGEVVAVKHATPIAESLASAWVEYRAANDPASFRDWLESSEAHADALTNLNDLRLLFRDVEVMGTTPREQLVCMRGVCEEIIPAGMTEGEFFDAIDPRTGG
ncbi:MAG: hypothetical protein GY715_13855, partial [Planctomycetes bacterium]|nr:hypothetical protein [Planctomycetota bacterium]